MSFKLMIPGFLCVVTARAGSSDKMVFVQSSVDYFLDPEYKPLFSYIMRLEAGQGDTINKYVLSIIKCYKTVFPLSVHIISDPKLLCFAVVYLLSSRNSRHFLFKPIRYKVETNSDLRHDRFPALCALQVELGIHVLL